MIIGSISHINSSSRSRLFIIIEIVLGNWIYNLKKKRQRIENSIITGMLTMSHFIFAKFFVRHLNIRIEMPEELRNLSKDRYLIAPILQKGMIPGSFFSPYHIVLTAIYFPFVSLRPMNTSIFGGYALFCGLMVVLGHIKLITKYPA